MILANKQNHINKLIIYQIFLQFTKKVVQNKNKVKYIMNINSFLASKKVLQKEKSIKSNYSEKTDFKTVGSTRKYNIKNNYHEDSLLNAMSMNNKKLIIKDSAIGILNKEKNSQIQQQQQSETVESNNSNTRSFKRTYSKQYIKIQDQQRQQDDVQQYLSIRKYNSQYNALLSDRRNFIQYNSTNINLNNFEEKLFKNKSKPEQSYGTNRLKLNFNKQEEKSPPNSKKVNAIFNSSRIQSKNCLQELSQKTIEQLTALKIKIEDYNQRINKLIQIEFQKLKATVTESIQKMFDNYIQNIKISIRKEIMIINTQIYQNKQELELIWNCLKNMKQQMESNNWRQIAAEILSSELEHKIQALLLKINKNSNPVNIQFQINRKRVQNFQEALEELIKFDIVPSFLSSSPNQIVQQRKNKID